MMVDIFIPVTYILLLRFFLFLFSRRFSSEVSTYVLVFFLLLMAFAVPLPLILIKKEIITDSAPNVILSGASIFYFGFVISRMLNQWKRKL